MANHGKRQSKNNRTQTPRSAAIDASRSQKRQSANQNSPEGEHPRIDLSELRLTEFTRDGRLIFNEKANEIWTLTPGQKEFETAFETHDALILRGPAGSGKTDITARKVLGLLRDGGQNALSCLPRLTKAAKKLAFVKVIPSKKCWSMSANT